MSLGSQVTPDSPLVDAVEAGIIRKLEFKEESVEEMPQLTLDCSAFMHAPVNWVWSRLPLRWDFLTFLMTAIVRYNRLPFTILSAFYLSLARNDGDLRRPP